MYIFWSQTLWTKHEQNTIPKKIGIKTFSYLLRDLIWREILRKAFLSTGVANWPSCLVPAGAHSLLTVSITSRAGMFLVTGLVLLRLHTDILALFYSMG